MKNLSSCNYVDPREVELQKLREVAAVMKREAEEAVERLAQVEEDYDKFITAMEASYEGDAEGLAWFRKMSSAREKQVELAALLEVEKAAFKVKEARYIAEKEELRREIDACDKRIEAMGKKEKKK